MFNRKSMNMLDSDISAQMLQNVFEACGVEPNTIPLEDLELYSNYRKDKYAVRRGILIIIMIIFILIPLMFIAPSISSFQQIDGESTAYRLSIHSLLPITGVTATIDGRKVPISEESRGEYTIRPETTGDMITVVTCINRQYDQKKIKVTQLDKDVPVVVSSSTAGGRLTLTVKDEGSGIDWEGITAVSIDGSTLHPLSCDEKTGEIVFSMPELSVSVFIPDLAGNKLKLVLTV